MLDDTDAPPNAYREAAQRLLDGLLHFLDQMEPVEGEPPECATARDVALGYAMNICAWIKSRRCSPQAHAYMAYGLGLPSYQGKSMSRKGKELSLSRAAISKGAKEFQRQLSLPPSFYMRSASACGAYSDARDKQLQP